MRGSAGHEQGKTVSFAVGQESAGKTGGPTRFLAAVALRIPWAGVGGRLGREFIEVEPLRRGAGRGTREILSLRPPRGSGSRNSTVMYAGGGGPGRAEARSSSGPGPRSDTSSRRWSGRRSGSGGPMPGMWSGTVLTFVRSQDRRQPAFGLWQPAPKNHQTHGVSRQTWGEEPPDLRRRHRQWSAPPVVPSSAEPCVGRGPVRPRRRGAETGPRGRPRRRHNPWGRTAG